MKAAGMMRFKSKVVVLQVMMLILLALAERTGPAAAQNVAAQARIIPPSPFQVYTSQTYTLTVGVTYGVGSMQYYLWIESPPSVSAGATVSGSGTVTFSLALTAPSTPGTYRLSLNLWGQARGTAKSIMDTASVAYQVIQPVITDWDVDKVWVEPAAPGVGDKVSFHATISLLSTNSPNSMTVAVACALDQQIIYSGSLTFSPQPSKQDLTVPNTWIATSGVHKFTCAVDPNNQYNDPTPYPYYNVKSVKFSVEPYYAIIQSIRTIPAGLVNEGDQFTIIITVAYHFPEGATLKVIHASNQTLPHSEQKIDNAQVFGSGTKDYTFQARTLFANYSYPGATWTLVGVGLVMFDRGSGAGWEKTDPGYESNYNLTVRRPNYYAVFESITAVYSSASVSTPQRAASTGLITITLNIRYLIPTQSGLWIYIMRPPSNYTNPFQTKRNPPNGTVILNDVSSITQTESIVRTATFTYEYSFPISYLSSPSMQSGQMFFTATIEYKAYGHWNFGDRESASASVPYKAPPAADNSITGYLMDAFQRIVSWFRTLLGYPQ